MFRRGKTVVVGFTVAMLPFVLIVLCIAATFLIPFVAICAINLLFETQVEYNFWNSVAIYVLWFLASVSFKLGSSD